MGRKLVTIGVSTAVIAIMMAGCGDGTQSATNSPTPPSSGTPLAPTPAEPPRYDPPLAFSQAGVALGVPASWNTYTIQNGIAYFVEDELGGSAASLIAADLSTGEQRWSQKLPEPSAFVDWTAPAVADTDAGPVVVIPLVVEEPGSGTRPSRERVRVFAYDGGSGSTAWATDLDDEDIGEISGYSSLSVLANHDHVAVSVEYHADGYAYTAYAAVLDPRDGNVRWLESEFLAQALDDQVVAGNTATREALSQTYTLVGRSAVDGQVLWTIDEPESIQDIAGMGSGLGYFVGVASGGSTTYLVPAR